MSGYQIGPETFYTFSFAVADADGEAVGGEEVIEAVFGLGQLLPAVERALEGRAEGESFEVVLEPRDAFGRRRAEAILEVDRADFPENVAPGDRFEAENADGGILVLHVLSVAEDHVVLDTNHPLADQKVTVSGKVLSVRPATADELEGAVQAMEEDLQFLNQPPPDVSVSSLLRPTPRG